MKEIEFRVSENALKDPSELEKYLSSAAKRKEKVPRVDVCRKIMS